MIRAPESCFGCPEDESYFPTPERCRSWNTRYAGKEAIFGIGDSGYCRGKLLNFSFRAHRLAWAIYFGEWPTRFIDHINCDRSDNRISNLREASDVENARNSKRSKANSSGAKGVYWYKRDKKWAAQITVNNRRMSLGRHQTKEAAALAYAKASAKLHGTFGRAQ